MKRGIILFLLLLQISLISADIFTVGDSGHGELSIKGNPLKISFTGIPEETPAGIAGAAGGGGGGTTVSAFQLDAVFLTLEIKKGESYQEEITITNERNEDIPINISIEALEKFVVPEEENFILKAGESRKIKFNIYFSEAEKPDVYLGKILFNYKNIQKTVNLILDVKEKLPLFDIKTTVIQKIYFLVKESMQK